MVLQCKSGHLVDGYALNITDGYSYTSPWLKTIDYSILSMSVSLVGNSPLGTVVLQQSCDLEADIGAAMGGGGTNPIYPVPIGPAQSVPKWADPYRGSSFVSDAANIPSGDGVVSQAVNGANTYILNQYHLGASFVRVVFTAAANANVAITIYYSLKG